MSTGWSAPWPGSSAHPQQVRFPAEPFAHIDVQLHPGRNLDIVTQVQAIDAFAADIVSDYGRYTCACAVLETAERLAGEERAPVPRCTG